MTMMMEHGQILLALVAVMTLVMLVLRMRHARTVRDLRRELARQRERIDTLERDLAALLSCSRRIGRRIGDGERNQRTFQKQLDRLQSADDGYHAIEHAMKLLSNGVPMSEITELCELSTGEVEILQSLSQHQAAA